MTGAASGGGAAPASRRLALAAGRGLHWLDFGGAGDGALVCLHGLTGCAGVWTAFAGAMRDRFRVAALDMRGHGESDPAESYDPEDYATDLDAFVEHLGAPRVSIVGLSLGALVAMRFAALRPGRLERLVVVDMSPAPGPHVVARMRGAGPYPESFASFDDAVEWAASAGSWSRGASLRDDLAVRLRRHPDGRWRWKADLAATSEAWLGRWAARAGLMWSCFETIACPVLAVRGAGSDYVTDEIRDRMLGANPRCRFVDVAGAGHNVPGEAPEAFLAAVRPFLLAEPGETPPPEPLSK